LSSSLAFARAVPDGCAIFAYCVRHCRYRTGLPFARGDVDTGAGLPAGLRAAGKGGKSAR